MMKKNVLGTLLVMVIIITSVVPGFAWNTDDYYYNDAYWVTRQIWSDAYASLNPNVSVSLTQYKSYGVPISVSPQSEGKAYPECANLDDVDLVARVIYGEVCNLSSAEDNAFAVAQVIKNRMGSTKTAREVVTANYQFSCVHDGNKRFGDPSLDNNPDLWAQCVFLAACIDQGYPIPTEDSLGRTYSTDIGSRVNFYDVGGSIPFYDVNMVQITSKYDIETKAKYYKPGSTTYTIKVSPIRIANHVYFSY